MEFQLDDLTIGSQEYIRFDLLSYMGQPGPTFKLMQTPKGDSLVIIYSWLDALSKTYNEHEEAFYIDNVNDENREKAIEIIKSVYENLYEEYNKDKNQLYNLKEYVLENFGHKGKKK